MSRDSWAGAIQHWNQFFAGEKEGLPSNNLDQISRSALDQITVQQCGDRPVLVRAFCSKAASQELVVESAQLRKQGQFPSILGESAGDILASRLVGNWNVLLIKEGPQKLLVFQGVSCTDAILLPGINLLLLVCHVDIGIVKECMAMLSQTPDFFIPKTKPKFGGYLVGHSRPYHCFYDGLLGLQAVIETGELDPNDNLFSKDDESFVDLTSCLGLNHPHQQLAKRDLNKICTQKNVYLLQLGFWFHTRAEDPQLRQLAENFDRGLRKTALRESQLEAIGALKHLENCKPLIWVGITGQKRSWIEQVEGTAELLNELHKQFPKLGVIFDGWTTPLTNSSYHRNETRNDDKVIRKIIKKLDWSTKGKIGLLTGLPLLEKVRVGLIVDAWIANYTSGSLNVSRICGKPGVGHIGVRMSASKHQHIHHCTRMIPIDLVKDLSDPSAPTGYINYSLPWQALYQALLEIIKDMPRTDEQNQQILEDG